MTEAAEKTFSFAKFELDTAARRLTKSGQTIALNPKAFDLLSVLVKNHGQILGKDELLETIWEGQFVEENNLTVHISALRKIFGETKSEHQFIATIPGKGYKFIAEVRQKTNDSIVKIDGATFEKRVSDAFDEYETIIGRAAEIAEIKDLLRGQNKILLTLTGAGGSGKTKLARTIAGEMRAEFAGGVFFIELAAINQPGLVVTAIAQALEVKESSNKSLPEALKDFLRERSVLLVLDNFEQLVSAASVVKELFDFAANLKILVTSRTPLRLKFEREKIVSPLDIPPPNSNLSAGELNAFAAIELFAVRARAARPNFALSEENAPVVAEICQKLDGLPLAIELAAVRVKLLSPQAILARLESSLNLLTGGAKDLPSRRRTMRGAIEWSYELLEAAERKLFRRLAVFADGFTIEAAEKLVENDAELIFSALDILTGLIDNNLLVRKEQADGGVRLRMLGVVREFALEMLQEAGELDDFRQAHARYFLSTAEEAEPNLQGEKGDEWLEKLENEHDNFRAALSWALKNDGETAVRIAAALRYFWLDRAHLTEGYEWSEAALRATENTFSEARSKLILANGVFLRRKGEYEAARKLYEKALTENKKTSDLAQIIKVNHGLAAVAVLQKDFASAPIYNEQALALSRELNDENLIAYSLCAYGDFELSRENTGSARPLLEECLALSKKLGNKHLLAIAYFNLGIVDYLEDENTAAASNFTESLQISREMSNKMMIAHSFDGFAALAVKNGNAAQSAKFAGAAEALRETIGYKIEPAEEIFREKYLAKVRGALNS